MNSYKLPHKVGKGYIKGYVLDGPRPTLVKLPEEHVAIPRKPLLPIALVLLVIGFALGAGVAVLAGTKVVP